MISKKLIAVGLVVSTISLGACDMPRKIEEAEFWQRSNSTSALYLQGPKAQQMLHQDIASCTSEIKELHRLGEIRKAIPANYNTGNELEERTADRQELDEWDTPERDGYLYGEHLPYHDFETCMTTRGWERAEYLPYDDVEKARKDYTDGYLKKKRRPTGDRENVTTLHVRSQDPPPYENLND